MSEVLAFLSYPNHGGNGRINGEEYFENDLVDSAKVIELFDYCQILLGYITKSGWKFLIEYYGYERLFELNNLSDWQDCESLDEYKATIKYEMSISPE